MLWALLLGILFGSRSVKCIPPQATLLHQMQENIAMLKAQLDLQKPKIVNPVKYKTQWCKFFNTTNGCEKGVDCTYAHYEHEFRFKTEWCRYVAAGYRCNKGADCTYAHSKDEMRAKVEI